MRRLVVALVLLMTLGLHWGVLQTVAWSSMVFNYSQTHGFDQAVTMTLDGSAPCGMCHAIQSAQEEADEEGLMPTLLSVAVLPAMPALEENKIVSVLMMPAPPLSLRPVAMAPPRPRPRA